MPVCGGSAPWLARRFAALSERAGHHVLFFCRLFESAPKPQSAKSHGGWKRRQGQDYGRRKPARGRQIEWLPNDPETAMDAASMAAAISSICVAAAADLSDALVALVLVLATAPLFVLNQRSSEIASRPVVADHRPPAQR
jgi:hypothetical protein